MRKSPSNTVLTSPVFALSGILVFFVLAAVASLPDHASAQRSISAINNVGDTISDPNEHPAFFSGEILLGNGVYYLQFPNGTPFGYYSYLSFMNDPNYIYHFDMGYEYFFDANDGHSGIFFYDFASNTFFYTSPSFPFPYLYDFTLSTVLYYFPNPNNPGHYTTNPRYFYDFATGQIITK